MFSSFSLFSSSLLFFLSSLLYFIYFFLSFLLSPLFFCFSSFFCRFLPGLLYPFFSTVLPLCPPCLFLTLHQLFFVPLLSCSVFFFSHVSLSLPSFDASFFPSLLAFSSILFFSLSLFVPSSDSFVACFGFPVFYLSFLFPISFVFIVSFPSRVALNPLLLPQF